MSDKWGQGKQDHLELSAANTGKYDAVVGKKYFATGQYMQYELQIIERFARDAPHNRLAIELGCGDGRVCFSLSKLFEQVYGYDMSPAQIRTAEREGRTRELDNVQFEVRDLEEEPLSLPVECASFISAGFGMGSFFRQLDDLIAQIWRTLCPRGIAVFSFYNTNALVYQLALPWKPALAAVRVAPEEMRLIVDTDESRRISAQSYSVEFIRNHLSEHFKLLHLTTYPALSALFPHGFFAEGVNRNICEKVDQLLADRVDIAGGPYILAVVMKPGELQSGL